MCCCQSCKITSYLSHLRISPLARMHVARATYLLTEFLQPSNQQICTASSLLHLPPHSTGSSFAVTLTCPPTSTLLLTTGCSSHYASPYLWNHSINHISISLPFTLFFLCLSHGLSPLTHHTHHPQFALTLLLRA